MPDALDDEAEAMLRRIAAQLDAWARDCVEHGEATHLVGPMRAAADSAWRLLWLHAKARGDERKARSA